MTTRIMLLEPTGAESAAIITAATARGYQVHAVTSPGGPPGDPDILRLLSGSVPADFRHAVQALRDITRYARRAGISAVLTTCEYLTPLAARACAELGLPGNDPALADAARDKAEMARQFTLHGVTMPRTHAVDSAAGLHALAASGELPLPWIVKPVLGAGSAGVAVAADADEAIAAFSAARSTRLMYGITPGPRILVQELITGAEYSIESFTQESVSTHLCATRKVTTSGAYRAELGHGLPATLAPGQQASAYRQVEQAITAAGIRNGPSHTEVIITPGGQTTVIETGARIAAGQIGFLIQHALGIDPWAACLDIALGQAPELSPARSGYATVRFLTAPEQGRLVVITGLPSTGPRVPAVRLRRKPGDIVGPATDNSARLGSLIVTGADQASADQHADEILARIQVKVAPSPAPNEWLNRD